MLLAPPLFVVKDALGSGAFVPRELRFVALSLWWCSRSRLCPRNEPPTSSRPNVLPRLLAHPSPPTMTLGPASCRCPPLLHMCRPSASTFHEVVNRVSLPPDDGLAVCVVSPPSITVRDDCPRLLSEENEEVAFAHRASSMVFERKSSQYH